MQERSRRGCDVVKVKATGGVITPGFAPHESQYGLPDLRLVADEARAEGLPVAAHATAPEGSPTAWTRGWTAWSTAPS